MPLKPIDSQIYLKTIFFLLLTLSLIQSPFASDTPSVSPYGIHTHITRNDEHPFLDRELELMQQAGIQWLRTGFVWGQILQGRDKMNYANHDEVVAKANKANINIMGLLHGAPRHAEPVIEHLEAWKAFVRETVSRYKGRVPAWQVWNEPNLKSFWKNPNPEHYGALLRETYPIIKQIDPDALVVWGATSQLDWPFLSTALKQAQGNFDVMAIHPYGYGDPRAPEAYIPDCLHDLRKLMSHYNVEEKPIWFTEWGWPSHTGRRGMSDRQQGQYIVRAYMMAMHNGLERGFWYEFQERKETDEENEDAFGILEHSLKPKPAYKAYSTLIETIPAGSKPISKPWKDGLIYYPAWTRPDGVTVHAVWVIWNRWQSPRMAPMHFEGEWIEAHDYLGKKVELKRDAKGKTTLPLDWGSPIYLIGPTEIEFE